MERVTRYRVERQTERLQLARLEKHRVRVVFGGEVAETFRLRERGERRLGRRTQVHEGGKPAGWRVFSRAFRRTERRVRREGVHAHSRRAVVPITRVVASVASASVALADAAGLNTPHAEHAPRARRHEQAPVVAHARGPPETQPGDPQTSFRGLLEAAQHAQRLEQRVGDPDGRAPRGVGDAADVVVAGPPRVVGRPETHFAARAPGDELVHALLQRQHRAFVVAQVLQLRARGVYLPRVPDPDRGVRAARRERAVRESPGHRRHGEQRRDLTDVPAQGERRARLRDAHGLGVVEHARAPLHDRAVLAPGIERLELGHVRQRRVSRVLGANDHAVLFRDSPGRLAGRGVEVERGRHLQVRLAIARGARGGRGDAHAANPARAARAKRARSVSS